MLQWRKDLETGDTAIDQEHREIFDRLNHIGAALDRGAEPEALRDLIRLLLDYTQRHFRHEEKLMHCRRCPNHEINCTAHQDFTARIIQWFAILNCGVAPASLISDVHAELCVWIEQHIAKVDIALRPDPVA